MENPVYYVQYAHARIASIGRRGRGARASRGCRSLDTSTSRRSTHERELELLRALAEYPDVRRRGGRAARAAPGHHVGARLRQGVPRLLPRLPGDHRRRRAHPGPALAGRGVPHRPRRARSRSSACTRPTRWRGSTTTTTTSLTADDSSRRADRPARCCPRRATRRRRRPPRRSAASTSTRSPASSARRSTCTTRTSCGPRCREYRDAFGADAVAYAGKAFLCIAMARLVAEEGLAPRRRDRRRAARRAARRVPGRARSCSTATTSRTPSCALALDAGVGRIVVDSFDELDRIEALVGERLPRARACSCGSRPASRRTRTSTSRPAPTTRSSGSPSSNGAARDAALRVGEVRRAATSPASTATSARRSSVLDSFAAAAAIVAELARRRRDARPATPVDELNLGGGLGVPLHRRRPTRRRSREYARASCATRSPRRCATAGARSRARARWSKPGRSIAAPAGVTLYRVGTIKEIPGVRTYVAVDGGMSDNPRPVTYGAGYEAFLPARIAAPRPLVATVAGKHCEQGDVLVRDAHLPGRRRGRRPARDAGDRRVRLLDGVATTTRCRARRWCSCATATPGSSCGARRSTISSLATT